MADKDDIQKAMEDFNLDDIPTPTSPSITFEESMELFAREEEAAVEAAKQVIDQQRLNYIQEMQQLLSTSTGHEYVDRYLQLKQVAKAEPNNSTKKAIIYATSDKAKEYIANFKGDFGEVKAIVEEQDIAKKAELCADYLTKHKLKEQLEKVRVYYNKNDPDAIQPPSVNSEELNKALNQTRKLTSEADRINKQVEAYFANGQKDKAIEMAEHMGMSAERHKYTFDNKDLIDAYNRGFKARTVLAKSYGDQLNQYTLSYPQNLAFKNLRDKFSGLDQFNNMAIRYIVAAEHLREEGRKPNIIEVSKLSNPKTFDETFKDKPDIIERVKSSINEIKGETVDEKTYLKLVSLFEENISNHMTVQFGYYFKDLKLKLPKVDQEMFLMKEKYPNAVFHQLETLSGKNSLDKQIRALTKNEFGFSTQTKYSENGKSIYIEPTEENKLKKPIVFIMSEDDIRQREFYVSVAKELDIKPDTSIYPLTEGVANSKSYAEKSFMAEIDGNFYKLFKVPEGHNGDAEMAYYEEIFDEELINSFKKERDQKLDNVRIIDGFKKQNPALEKPVAAIDFAMTEINAANISEEKKEPLIGDLNIEKFDQEFKQVSVYLKNFMVVNAALQEIDKRYTEERKALFSKVKDFEEKVILDKALKEKYYGFDEELVSVFAQDKLKKLEGKSSELPENINEYFADKYLNDKKTLEALKATYPFISDIEKDITEKINQSYNKSLSDPNEAMHNATVAVFSKEFKLDEEKTKELFSKKNLLSAAGTALKCTSLVINPVGFAVSQAVKGLIKTPQFQDFKDRLANRVDNALNAAGITQGTATRKYLGIAAGVAAGAAIGAYLVIANDVSVESLKALTEKLTDFGELNNVEVKNNVSNVMTPELTDQQAQQLNKDLIQSRPEVEQFTTSMENVIQPATSREIGAELLKGYSTPEFEAKILDAGYRMSDIEMALNQNINEQMLQGKFPADTTIELIGKNSEAITIHMNADQLDQTKAALEAAMAKTQVITNGTIIQDIPKPDIAAVIQPEAVQTATPESINKVLDTQPEVIAKATPEEIGKALEAQQDQATLQPVQPTVIEIKSGDSLYEIAQKQLGENATAEKIDQLIAAISHENNIKNPNLIFIGDQLTIPDISTAQPEPLRVAFNDPTDLYTNGLYLPPSGVDKLAEQMAETYLNGDIDPHYKESLVDKFKEVIQYHSEGEPYANLSNNSFRYDISQVILDIQEQERVANLEQEMKEEVQQIAMTRTRGMQI